MVSPGEHRETARVLLRNRSGEIFLLLTHFDPEVGLPPRWLTPGGGIDSGETPVQAAVRELREETGLIVSERELGDLIWQTSGRWSWADGNHHTFTDYFFTLTVDDFVLNDSAWTEDERRDVVEFRWWQIDDLVSGQEFVGPPGLLGYLSNRR